jgi:hypothetical protein
MDKQGVKTTQKGVCGACSKPIVGQVVTEFPSVCGDVIEPYPQYGEMGEKCNPPVSYYYLKFTFFASGQSFAQSIEKN